MRLAVRVGISLLAFVLGAIVAELAAVWITLDIGYGPPDGPRWLLPYLVPVLTSVGGTLAAVVAWRRTGSRRSER